MKGETRSLDCCSSEGPAGNVAALLILSGYTDVFAHDLFKGLETNQNDAYLSKTCVSNKLQARFSIRQKTREL